MSLQRSRGVYFFVGVAIIVLMFGASRSADAQEPAPGGFVESDASLSVRPLLTPTQIQSFLPARGPFTFPAPYLTTGIRLTNATDCAGGADCVNGVGYAYWRNINNHIGSNTMLIVLGLDRQRGGNGPTLFSYNKVTGATANLGPLFDASSPFSWISGEDSYFSATQPTTLYLTTVGSARWYRYDVVSHTMSTVFDASTRFGSNIYIWQMHTSNDDRVHSFTLRDSTTYAMLGCGAYREDTKQWYYFPARGDFDECQIDKSGRWLLIKENLGLGTPAGDDDNLVEDLETGAEATLMDVNGAPGHSDNGYGYMVGEDNFFSLPGAVRVWYFDRPFTDPSQGKLVFYSTSWSWGSNHIAHSNARADLTIGQQWACSSDANRLNLPSANEVLCYRLDGSLQTLVVAPIMTNLDAPGGGPDEYWKLPKGNLDVSGEYFIWTANLGGNRLDAFLVHIPIGMLPPPIDGSAVPAPLAPSSGSSPSTPTFSASTPTVTSSCATPDPFVAMGGGTCVNGGWLPPGMAIPSSGSTAPSSSTSSSAPTSSGSASPSTAPTSCTSIDPFKALGGGTCVNGGWLPPGMAIPSSTSTATSPLPSTSSSAPSSSGSASPSTASTSCTSIDPFKALGGGTCLNGGWLPPGMIIPSSTSTSTASTPPSSPSSSGSALPATTSTSCASPDPFTILGGGTCRNGGWLPPGMVTP